MTVTRNPLSILATTFKDAAEFLRASRDSLSSLAPLRHAAWWRIALASPLILFVLAFCATLTLMGIAIMFVCHVVSWPFTFFAKPAPAQLPRISAGKVYVLGERGPEMIVRKDR